MYNEYIKLTKKSNSFFSSSREIEFVDVNSAERSNLIERSSFVHISSSDSEDFLGFDKDDLKTEVVDASTGEVFLIFDVENNVDQRNISKSENDNGNVTNVIMNMKLEIVANRTSQSDPIEIDDDDIIFVESNVEVIVIDDDDDDIEVIFSFFKQMLRPATLIFRH